MKTLLRLARVLTLVTALLAGAGSPENGAAAGLPDPPRVLSTKLADGRLVIRVMVPPGLRKLTLEGRLKLGHGAWVPRAVQRLDGAGGEVVFEVPLNPRAAEMFRVRADENEPLPAAFYEGETEFDGALSVWGPGWPEALDAGLPPGGETIEVQESDIWRLYGDTLYFFNQFRGLQVIDVADPDAPVLRGQLSVPAAGEQMYVLDKSHVLLLVSNACGAGGQRQVWVVRTDGVPEVVAKLDLAGAVLESRLVGRVLYMVTSAFVSTPESGAFPFLEEYRWETVVEAFDFTDPEAPVLGDELRLPGSGGVVQATDRWLMVALPVAASSWRNPISDVHLIDIAAGDGALRERGVIRVHGRIADKFKLHLNGDVLSVIAEDRSTTRVSRLATFSIADPDLPVKLGEIEVGHGEALFATRFDGDRAYIVTFERVDPLWIVDLSNPRRPTVSGELEIPGWSTFIHPMGDRLVTVGIDNANGWKVAVQLFDVADPRRPALLSKVPLGEDHSWSEANHDEKAFTVLEDEGLILLPYQEWGAGGQQARVQLIDLERDQLRARGVIEHAVQPRRATSHRGRLVSISARELVTVNAADRDTPEVTSLLELAWPVNRVLVAGDFLLEVSDGNSWLGNERPRLRVVSRAAPDEVLAEFAPPAPWPIMGCAQQDGLIYLLQSRPLSGYVPFPDEGENPPPSPENLCLTVLGTDDLPVLTVLGSVRVAGDGVGYLPPMEALWPRPGLLVWAARGDMRGFPFWGPFLDVGMPDMWGPWWWTPGGRFFVFDVAAAAAPVFLADVQTDAPEAWASTGAFVGGGLIFFSEQRATFLPDMKLPEGKLPGPTGIEKGAYVNRHYLRVLDLNDPGEPTLRPPVNLPGELRGVSSGGAVVYTVGPKFDAEGKSDWKPWFSACAYDGVAASLITQAPLPDYSWATPVEVPVGWVVAGWNPEEKQGWLELWRLGNDGKFSTSARLKIEAPVSDAVAKDDLLLMTVGSRIDLYDGASATLAPVGSLERPDCLGFRLGDVAGAPATGFWVPLGDYGVLNLPRLP